MDSNLNFKNFESDSAAGGGRLPGSFSLKRQPSVYSLTFDEFQTTMDKDFGSMNMDELLKSIWSAEDNNIGSTSRVNGGQQGDTSLQKQGSIVLPRTLSQKTVDEVWRDMSREYDAQGEKNSSNIVNGFGVLPQRQQTLGEITIEEFLVRAGVVREENHLPAELLNKNLGYFGDLWHPVSSSNFGFGEFSNQIANKPDPNSQLNVQQQQLEILPNRGEFSSPSVRGGVFVLDQAMNNNNDNNTTAVQNSVLQTSVLATAGLGNNNKVSVGMRSPGISPDELSKSNVDTSPVLPVPYVFNDGLRGRRSSALEKVVERRQRRMIKNRESAAKSRARKQAYTVELEEEIVKLKEEYEELQKKQAEMMEMHKNEVVEMMKQQNGGKRICLGRTRTGPW